MNKVTMALCAVIFSIASTAFGAVLRIENDSNGMLKCSVLSNNKYSKGKIIYSGDSERFDSGLRPIQGIKWCDTNGNCFVQPLSISRLSTGNKFAIRGGRFGAYRFNGSDFKWGSPINEND